MKRLHTRSIERSIASGRSDLAEVLAQVLVNQPTPRELLPFLAGLLALPIGRVGLMVAQESSDSCITLAEFTDLVAGCSGCPDASLLTVAVEDSVQALRRVPKYLALDPTDGWPVAAWRLSHRDHPTTALVMTFANRVGDVAITTHVQPLISTLAVYFASMTLTLGQLSAAGSEGSRHPRTRPLLTSRQRMILGLMADDLTNHQIARLIGFSESTVGAESVSIYRTLGVANRQQAVEVGRSYGIVSALPDSRRQSLEHPA
jgi:DNA-binding CsgD family transcriptional regulator